MLKTYLFLLLVLTIPSISSQEITLENIQPSNGVIVGENLQISVKVNSTYEIDKVEVIINSDVIVELFSIGSNIFTETQNLSFLVEGAYTYQIVVTDLLGNIQSKEETFLYDTKPKINVSLPLDYTVARPNLKIQFEGSDIEYTNSNNVLRYKVEVLYQTSNNSSPIIETLLKSNSKIDEELDLTFFEGRSIQLLLTVTDGLNQSTTIRKKVFIDTSNPLTNGFSVEGEIVDFDGTHILSVNRKYIKTKYDRPEYAITKIIRTNIETNEKTIIPYLLNSPPLYDASVRFLNRNIIILGTDDENRAINSVDNKEFVWDFESQTTSEMPKIEISEYNNGRSIRLRVVNIIDNKVYSAINLYKLVELSPGSFLYVSYPNNYYTHNKTDVSIYKPLNGFTHEFETDYASIGKIVDNDSFLYYDEKGNIIHLKEGIKKNVTNDGSPKKIENINVLSDGNLYIYTKKLNNSYDDMSIMLFDGNNEIKLRGDGNRYIQPNYDYQINNGYVAFSKSGNLGQELIKLRKPSGKIITAAPFGTNSYLELLNKKGEILFLNSSFDNTYSSTNVADRHLYIDGTLFQVSRNSLGTPYFKNNNWYVSMGNTLFTIDTSKQLKPLGINENEIDSNKKLITIYPNPISNIINIDFLDEIENGKISYTIFNLMGQEVKKGNSLVPNQHLAKINVENLKPGIYFLSIKGINIHFVKKIIIE